MAVPIRGSKAEQEIIEKVNKYFAASIEDVSEEFVNSGEVVARLTWRERWAAAKFHLLGQHDQQSHGDWADGAPGDTGHGSRLATARPTSKGKGSAGSQYRSGFGARMGVDLITDDMLKDKKTGPGLVTRQASVPGFEDLAGRTDRAVLEEIVERQAKNIEEVADLVLANSRKEADATAAWYPWSHDYVTGLAEENGVSVEGALAATAALSASAAWESNVPWSKYLIENLATNKGPDGGINQKVDAKWAVAAYLNEVAAKHAPSAEGLAGLVGKRLGDLSDNEIALVMRGKHDASGEFVSKTGKFSMGEVRQLGDEVHAGFGKAGAGTVPQSVVNIAKAVSVLRNPSTENIEAAIGNQNKVRSFYQNLRDPLDDEWDDVTVDTHHMGIANGIPMTISSRFIESGTNNIVSTPGNAETGALGSYPLVVEATRRATDRLNKRYGTSYRPNQVQSIAWEAWKDRYPPRIRSNKAMQESIELALSARARGDISEAVMKARIDAARTQAGGPTVEELIKKYQEVGN